MKMMVQRSRVWVMWREPPRDSMRCWVWVRPSWDEVVVLVGWLGAMGLVHMHSRVSLSVSMVRVAVLEGGCVLGGVVDELGDDADELLADAWADVGVVEQVDAVGGQVGVSVCEGFLGGVDGVGQGWWG
ncbi:hypothetical protein [Actinomyces viscosus]|uniref:hypothetical protein n=1 Tax=Actinomyces viscosus TaxID=1656 RepID=UPI002852D430|nr:hypothetical protein [Actinomyces viscosus]